MYDILLGGQPVGKAQVEKEGLYYRISCRCRLSGEVVCKVEVSCGDRGESLGVLVPESGAFVLSTRIPAKKLGEGPLQFRVVPRQIRTEGKFVPISPEEPFAYLSRLENAYMQVRNGQTGIVLRE